MNKVYVLLTCLVLLAGCKETVKEAADAVGDAGNQVAKTVKDTIERNKD